jgi:head-tail adaptor
MTFDKPLTIQKQDQDTEQWKDFLRLHSRVNKKSSSGGVNAGADQFHARLSFDIRYFSGLEEIRYDPQMYRILYREHTFRVTDYDDYMEQHRTIRLEGELYE